MTPSRRQPEPGTLGARLREARLASKFFKQERLAMQANVEPFQISAWELGDRTPQDDQLARLAKALGVTSEWLRGFEK